MPSLARSVTACILALMTTLRAAGTVPSWTTGDRLRKAREFAGLSQEQLAEAMGISRRTVSTYEGDAGATVKRPTLLAWAMLCGVDMDWLKSGEAPGPSDPGANMDGGKTDIDFHGNTWSHTSSGIRALHPRRAGERRRQVA